jgi:hypothetical protein
MNQGRTVFAQVMGHAPHKAFQGCVARYPGVRRGRRFTCWDQFLCMVFAQLAYRESLRESEALPRCGPGAALPHGHPRHGLRSHARADANEERDWSIYADLPRC